jgi:hypothetical protein
MVVDHALPRCLHLHIQVSRKLYMRLFNTRENAVQIHVTSKYYMDDVKVEKHFNKIRLSNGMEGLYFL